MLGLGLIGIWRRKYTYKIEMELEANQTMGKIESLVLYSV